MMPTKNNQVLSEFGQAALALDNEFRKFDDLSTEFERIVIPSDKGLSRAQEVLGEIETCRGRMAKEMQAFSAVLVRARERCDRNSEVVNHLSEKVRMREKEAEQFFLRFRELGEKVGEITLALAQWKESGDFSTSDSTWSRRIPEFGNKIKELVDQAYQLVEDARTANLQDLERNVDALRKSLQAARNRFNLFTERKESVSA